MQRGAVPSMLWSTEINYNFSWERNENQRRVLITLLAAEAWEYLCRNFNFDNAANRIGLRITVDGCDDLIKYEGIQSYNFKDNSEMLFERSKSGMEQKGLQVERRK